MNTRKTHFFIFCAFLALNTALTGVEQNVIIEPQQCPQTAPFETKSEKVKRFYLSTDVSITHIVKDGSVVGSFQLPPYIQENECRKTSPDNNYLLILNAARQGLLYNSKPTKYEWNLYDVINKKTIKTFDRESYPHFDQNHKDKVIFNNNKEVSILSLIQQRNKTSFERFIQYIQTAAASFIQQIKDSVNYYFSSTQAPSSFEQAQNKDPEPKQEQMVTDPANSDLKQLDVQTSKSNDFSTPPTEKIPPTIIPSSQNKPPKKLNPYKSPSLETNSHNQLVSFPKAQEPTIALLQGLTRLFTPQQSNTLIIMKKDHAALAHVQQKLIAVIELATAISQSINDQAMQEYSSALKDNSSEEIEIVNYPATIQEYLLKHADEQVLLTNQIQDVFSLLKQLPEKDLITILTQFSQELQKHSLLFSALQNINDAKKLKATKEKIKALEGTFTAEKPQAVLTFYNQAQEIDAAFVQLSPESKQRAQEELSSVIQNNRNPINDLIKKEVTTTWNQHGTQIITILIPIIQTVVQSALLGILTQKTLIRYDMQKDINHDLLIINGCTAALATLISQQLNSSSMVNALVSGGAAQALTESLLVPLTQDPTSYSVQLPSISGPLQSAILYEIIGVVQTMIEKEGGLADVIKKVYGNELFLRPYDDTKTQKHRKLIDQTITNPSLVKYIQRNRQKEDIKNALTIITTNTLTTGCAYALMYATGITNDTALYQAFVNGVFIGMQNGIAQMLIETKTEHTGALITITSSSIVPLIKAIVTETIPSDAIQSLISTTTQVVVNEALSKPTVLIDTAKTLWSKTSDAIRARTPSFSFLSKAWAAVKETFSERPNLDETSDDFLELIKVHHALS